MVSVLACVVLAVISWAALPTVPSYDPWSWIVWGREVSDPRLAFQIGGGPSFKPLPFVFTTVWGLFGAAAPTLWVITARAAGLLGLVAAARLAIRLGGGRDTSPPARVAAGALAVVVAGGGIVLTQDWPYYFLRGTSEVGLVACTLWAVDRLLAGRRGSAFWLAVAASLIRPEAWPFLLAGAAWLAWRGSATARSRLGERVMLLAGLALVPILWFGPPWIGSGHPLLAATHAAGYDGHLGDDPLRTVLSRGLDLQLWPLLVLAGAGVWLAWRRDRDRRLAVLGAGVVAWWVVVVAMTLDGYPGLERFFLPAAAVVSVLAGAAVARAARGLAGTVVVAAVALGGCGAVAAVSGRAGEASSAGPAAREAARSIDGLDRAARAAGGHRAVFPCHDRSLAAVNHAVQPALAWALHASLERVSTRMSDQGVDFVGPHTAANGAAAPVDPRLTRAEPLASVGGWRVLRLTDPRNPHGSGCAGR